MSELDRAADAIDSGSARRLPHRDGLRPRRGRTRARGRRSRLRGERARSIEAALLCGAVGPVGAPVRPRDRSGAAVHGDVSPRPRDSPLSATRGRPGRTHGGPRPRRRPRAGPPTRAPTLRAGQHADHRDERERQRSGERLKLADLDPEIREAAEVVLEGGETAGTESTVVDVSSETIHRRGAQADEIDAWLEDS